MQTGAILGKGRTARMVWAGGLVLAAARAFTGLFSVSCPADYLGRPIPRASAMWYGYGHLCFCIWYWLEVFFLFSHLFKRIVFNLGHCDKFFSRSFRAVNSIKQESSPCCQSWEGLQWFFHVVVLSLGQLAELRGGAFRNPYLGWSGAEAPSQRWPRECDSPIPTILKICGNLRHSFGLSTICR